MRHLNHYYKRFGIVNPAYNVVRIAGWHIYDRASKYFSGRMLEVGCGTKAKTLLIGEFVDEHIGIDIPDTPHIQSNIDIFGTAYRLPIKRCSYDCVLSTSVLEHLEEPRLALFECFRVLKPGGYALYTVPLYWHLHEEPRDFFRYTKYGLAYLFKEAGFEIVEISPMSGFWTTFVTEWNYYLSRFRHGPLKPMMDGIVIMNNLILCKLDRGVLLDEKFTWMYLVVVKKPK
jgi:SAM-dependent methyltransferase